MYNPPRNAYIVPKPAAAVGQRRPVQGNMLQQGQLPAGGQKQGPFHQQLPPLQQQYNQQQRMQPPQQQQQNYGMPPMAKMEPQPLQPPQQFQPPPAPSNNEDGDERRPKMGWPRNFPGKVSRKERIRRRNKKLVKILQPKNAIMVLNEMVPNVTYNITALDSFIYKASVSVNGAEFTGTGKTKILAKASAAEAAIKHVVLLRLKSANAAVKSDVDGTQTGMETEEEEEVILPWQHVASLALHKLFTTWDDSGNFVEQLLNASNGNPDTGVNVLVGQTPEKKPAKKMPDNPTEMNPIMLLNQMMPKAVYEQVSKTGNPPHIVFGYKCTAETQTFYGTGSSKKVAKKMCAFEACRTVLKVEYPLSMYNPADNPQNPPAEG